MAQPLGQNKQDTSSISAPIKENKVNCDAGIHANSHEHSDQVGTSFLYMPVEFQNTKFAALCDSGSSINIMSDALYHSLALNERSSLSPDDKDSIVLANNQTINVLKMADVNLKLPVGCEKTKVYVLEHSSHPLILGVSFMKTLGVQLDLAKSQIQITKVKCRTRNMVTVPPYSESFIWVKVSDTTYHGIQGICTASKGISHTNLLVAKTLVCVTSSNTLPLKVMNPTNEVISLKRNVDIAVFETLCGPCHIIHPFSEKQGSQSVNHVHVQHEPHSSVSSGMPVQSEVKPADFEKFTSNFDLSQTKLNVEQQAQLLQVLFKNKDLFITDDNPSLGLTNLVQHKIHLKPNAQLKHQRPYRLSPDKRRVLRHQLDELLEQGIIVPANENGDLPITSPVVLVSKQHTQNSLASGSREASLSQFRFCVDFRHLNSQTQDFNYAIPDLQELTESFAENTPCYLSSIDLKSAFFQMPISAESTKLTAFNTCFRTYKFLCLPQGLKTAPNSFQLLMDKVLCGLTFSCTLCYLDDILL